MTQGPGAGPGASCPSTRCGTPMPAGRSPGSLCDSWTRTRTGTLLPRGRRALPSPRPPLAAPDSDGTHHVTLSGTPSSPRDHGADSRKSATVDPQGDGPVPECPRPTPGATRAASKYFDRPEPHVTQAHFHPVLGKPHEARARFTSLPDRLTSSHTRLRRKVSTVEIEM